MVHAHAHKLTSGLFELLPPRRGKNEMGVRVENEDHLFLCPSPSRGRMQKGEPHTIILSFFLVAFCVATANAAESKPNWQTEWARTVQAAEEEGQLTVYVSGYGALIDSGVF